MLSPWRSERGGLSIVHVHIQLYEPLQGLNPLFQEGRGFNFQFPCCVQSPASPDRLPRTGRCPSPLLHREQPWAPAPVLFPPRCSQPCTAARPKVHFFPPPSFGLRVKRETAASQIHQRQLGKWKIETNGAGEDMAVSSDLSGGAGPGPCARSPLGPCRRPQEQRVPCRGRAPPSLCHHGCQSQAARQAAGLPWPLIASSAPGQGPGAPVGAGLRLLVCGAAP